MKAWMLLALIAVAAGCGGATENRALVVTFDGERCTYEGPAEIGPGEIGLTFHNQSTTGATGWVDLSRIDADRSAQDVIDHLAGDDAEARPEWVTRVDLVNDVANESSTPEATSEVQAGLHVIVCGTNSPYSAIYGASLTVVP